MKPAIRKYITKSVNETQKLGARLARKFSGGEILSLIGTLGGGKTVFAKGVAKGLGIKRNITSPTFIFWRLYKVSKRKNIKYFCHIDLYRLPKPQELFTLGIDEYWQRDDTVCLIEWAEKIKKYLPNKKRYFVKFEILNPKIRKIIIENQ